MKTPRNGRHETNGHPSLEERVALLEAEVARLKQAPVATDGFEALVGSQAGNPFFEQVVCEMERFRHEEYARAKGQARPVGKPRTKRRAVGAK